MIITDIRLIITLIYLYLYEYLSLYDIPYIIWWALSNASSIIWIYPTTYKIIARKPYSYW